jgi:hypothetical protein
MLAMWTIPLSVIDWRCSRNLICTQLESDIGIPRSRRRSSLARTHLEFQLASDMVILEILGVTRDFTERPKLERP